MKILHICSDFPGSKVHQNLYRSLDDRGVKQEIYTYFIEDKYVGRNFFESSSTNIHYACILKQYDRYFYRYKGWKVTRDLLKRVDVKKVNLSHATTLFSDGGIAYRLYKKYGIPYIVTVRNSDINLHLKKAWHEWPYARLILLNAESIVFISEALKKSFCEHPYIRRFLNIIEDRICVQPNGVESFWIDNCDKERVVERNNHNLIYVGVFDDNKNIFRLVDAVLSLKVNFPDIHLTLVGGRGDLKNEVKKLAEKHKGVIEYKGQVSDLGELRHLYRQCSVFVMPSIHETFGLVYIEAMSQGLACVYTKGQGIDGMFSKEVGEAINPLSIEDISKGTRKILTNRDSYNNKNIDFEQFRWSNISENYYKMYKSIVEQ